MVEHVGDPRWVARIVQHAAMHAQRGARFG
ncbi:hypothetical protein P873_10580 [Arenimonas composti TR7-09 = DSM 18010]|uniref:Uncharacterized protein n=1 Tax=Arenimonas composti TR7-09 = DSM 18010 TaxID=1121013 RepID=A0A091BYZ5_9GAMM|nr:hypothetical protein P873_10580 [Arenimonas composti TR7-09 = DSM 18010]